MNENNDNRIKTMVIVTCMLLIVMSFSSTVGSQEYKAYEISEKIIQKLNRDFGSKFPGSLILNTITEEGSCK